MGQGLAKFRYCRCGARLARDNPAEQCTPCQRAARDRAVGPPDVPADFWVSSEQLRDALEAWHMGRVIAAYRTHPHHRPPLVQAMVAGWMGLTQAQLSRIEAGPPITDLLRLIRWAQLLRIPPARLWFKLPEQRRATDRPAVIASPGRLQPTLELGAFDPVSLPLATGSLERITTLVRDLHLPEEVVSAVLGELWSTPPTAAPDDARTLPYPGPIHDALVDLLRAWANTVKRREFLLSLGRTATAAATIPLLSAAAEPARIAGAVAQPSRVDAAIIGHIEEVLSRALSQDAALGPQAAIQTVLDQRHLARRLLDGCPTDLRSRLLSVYAGLCRATGWFLFDLGHFNAAVPHFEEGRTAAHEARNTELGALILCNLAQSAIWQHRPRLAVDHASAAVAWAWRTPDRALQANAGDIAARAFAAAGDYGASMQELERAAAALAKTKDAPSLVGWYDEAFLTGIHGQCLLTLGRPAEALAILVPAVEDLDPSVSVRNVALQTVDLAEAYIQHGEVDGGVSALARAGELAARNQSVRLGMRLRAVHRQLEPWRDTATVRELEGPTDDSRDERGSST